MEFEAHNRDFNIFLLPAYLHEHTSLIYSKADSIADPSSLAV